MGRLIDADRAIDELGAGDTEIYCKCYIEDRPTAYDVEAVVKQIEELPTKKTTKMVESKEAPEWFYEVVTGEYIKKDDVVEIVRRGGVGNG